MKSKILPVFIPFLGCKNRCLFCNQQAITGQTIENIFLDCEEQIKNYIVFSKDWDEIAFFGGSFTCIDKEIRKELYLIAKKYHFKNIRISTRPDCIDETIIEELKHNNVRVVEIGVQSTSDDVLAINGRHYNRTDIFDTFKLLNSEFKTSAQLMVGMYKEEIEDIFSLAKDIKIISPNYARIYPTVVLKDSPLSLLYKNKNFKPDEAYIILAKAALLYSYLSASEIKVIRIGLPESIDFRKHIDGGFYHPATGDIVKTVSVMAYAEKFKRLPFLSYGYKRSIVKNYGAFDCDNITYLDMMKNLTGGDIEDNWRFFERAANIIFEEL